MKERKSVVMDNPKKFNLQFFAEEDGEDTEISAVNQLDLLMDAGKTDADLQEDDENPEEDDAPEKEADETDKGGDQDLTDQEDEDTEAEDEPVEKAVKQQAPADKKAAAAYAKLRTDNAKLNKTIMQIAKALDLDTSKGDVLVGLSNLAANKLAQKENLSVEVYNELNTTREQLQELQRKHNVDAARKQVYDLKVKYGLEEDDLGTFLDSLDAEGVNPIDDPSIDLEYHYYKMNKDTILDTVKEKARQEALKSSLAGKANKPGKLTGKRAPDNDKKIDSVKGLDELMAGR